MMDIDKDFLSPFRDRSQEGGYIGLGKLIDGVVRLAAYMDDDEVLSCKNRIVKGIIQTQEPDGYIGIMRPEKRVESLWDVHEMSYLIVGLTSNYRFFGEEASLDAARRLGDYLLRRWTHEPEKIPDGNALSTLGIESAMLSLYEHTHDPKYLDFCTKQCSLQEWDAPIVLGRWGMIEGHAYNYLHRCLAQLHLHSLQPDPRLLQPTRRAFDFMTRRDGMTITGLLGDHECWD
ncbi:MAG: glycoside hydrolase family 127 protein, partial [Candidatus Latescibacteria bacterium]|nr:glycoside hydrolase family 127 protein [Candidatus Latescibacterota bacterium]